MGNKVYYFSHDVNASTDTKILKLRKKYGLAGYGLFWIIIERMRESENYKIEYTGDEFEALEFFTMSEIDIIEFLEFCLKIKLFELDQDNYIYSESLNRRMNIFEEKLEKRRLAGRKGAEKRWQSYDNVIEQDSNITSNNKKKKTKEKNISLVEVKEYVENNNLSVNPNTFFEYYESKNWMISNEKIKDWKAVLVKWNDNNINNNHIVKSRSKLPSCSESTINYDSLELIEMECYKKARKKEDCNDI